ncbi:hypothetical protein VNO80_19049 [Phaseolus coccineus]|uniref:Uncharacterized protein n=1 Tax=Phaseolus coccineus TaxID=3886 RepID=A0AAN9R095_PHACN
MISKPCIYFGINVICIFVYCISLFLVSNVSYAKSVEYIIQKLNSDDLIIKLLIGAATAPSAYPVRILCAS